MLKKQLSQRTETNLFLSPLYTVYATLVALKETIHTRIEQAPDDPELSDACVVQ